MTRGINSSFKTQLQSADPKPIILLKIATGDSTEPYIYISSDEADTVFPSTSGATYTARPFVCSEVKIDGSEQPAIEVTLADVDLAVDTWLDTTDFRFAKVTRYLVERDSLDSSAKSISDTFRVISRTRSDRVATFRAEPLSAILARLELPRTSLTREDFPAIPDRGVVR